VLVCWKEQSEEEKALEDMDAKSSDDQFDKAFLDARITPWI